MYPVWSDLRNVVHYELHINLTSIPSSVRLEVFYYFLSTSPKISSLHKFVHILIFETNCFQKIEAQDYYKDDHPGCRYKN